MKTSKLITLIVLIGLVGGFLWLLQSSDSKHVQRNEIRVDIADTFER